MTTLKELSNWPQSRLMAAFTSRLPKYPEDYHGIARMPPVSMRSPMALLLQIMAVCEQYDARGSVMEKFSLSMDGYIKNGLLTPNYGDLYELATAYAGYRDNKNIIEANVGIVFAFGEDAPDHEDKNNESSHC